MSTIHNLNYMLIQRQNLQSQIERAQIRDIFFEQDNYQIQRILAQDLRKYVSLEDIPEMKYITLDFFVSAFLEKLCNIYDTPPIWKFQDRESENAKKLIDLLNRVKIVQIMQENNLKMRLHNTILNYVRYNEELNRIYIQNNYNVGNCWVQPYDSFYLEPKIIAYPSILENNEIRWFVWNRERGEHYYINNEPKYDYDSKDLVNDKFPIPGNEDISFTEYFPWVVYRYKDHNDFWGNGLDSIIELVRSINVLLTVCDDDSIRETIRILIFNFDIQGAEGTYETTTGAQKKHFKTGIRHPIFAKNELSGDGVPIDAKILSADLFNDEIIQFVEKITDIVSSLHNIDNILKTNLEQNLSGISLRLRNEPLLRQWAKDINTVRYSDLELIRKIVEVHNYHIGMDATGKNDNWIDPVILEEFSIDYQEPKVVTDEKEEFGLEMMKCEKGVGSLIEYVMKKNPEFNREQAKEYIKRNLEEWEELTGLMTNINVNVNQSIEQ